MILDVVCRTTGMGFAAVARVTGERWIACGVRDEIAFRALVPGGELKVETTICHEVRQGIAKPSSSITWRDRLGPIAGTRRRRFMDSRATSRCRSCCPTGSFFGTLCAIDPKPARVNRPEIVGLVQDVRGSHRLSARRPEPRGVERRPSAIEIWKVSRDMLGVADSAGDLAQCQSGLDPDSRLGGGRDRRVAPRSGWNIPTIGRRRDDEVVRISRPAGPRSPSRTASAPGTEATGCCLGRRSRPRGCSIAWPAT